MDVHKPHRVQTMRSGRHRDGGDQRFLKNVVYPMLDTDGPHGEWQYWTVDTSAWGWLYNRNQAYNDTSRFDVRCFPRREVAPGRTIYLGSKCSLHAACRYLAPPADPAKAAELLAHCGAVHACGRLNGCNAKPTQWYADGLKPDCPFDPCQSIFKRESRYALSRRHQWDRERAAKAQEAEDAVAGG